MRNNTAVQLPSSVGRRRRPALAILVALVVGSSFLTVGCASSSSTNSAGAASATSTTHLAKTKFLLHAGLAFGAFHRYIYKPLKTGAFSGGLFHHKLATLKAALAAAFAYHEVKLALTDARSSKILSRLLSPLLALQTRFHALVSGLRNGSVNSSAIQSANALTGRASQAGAKAGQNIKDLVPASPGG
ncbi:MAG: hypothetical protein QOF83_1051 [Solirubrobacteraceae bacterium]|nr:hypothetical protein [Solirubrobacteraceae bacterium]